ncbi:MAG: hypothetical protein RI894_1528 [Bacteroidota bacterium]|jgi:hypothetical protein
MNYPVKVWATTLILSPFLGFVFYKPMDLPIDSREKIGVAALIFAGSIFTSIPSIALFTYLNELFIEKRFHKIAAKTILTLQSIAVPFFFAALLIGNLSLAYQTLEFLFPWILVGTISTFLYE